MIPTELRALIKDIEAGPVTRELEDRVLVAIGWEHNLMVILPMAKGWAHLHDVGSNKRYVQEAEALLAKAQEASDE